MRNKNEGFTCLMDNNKAFDLVRLSKLFIKLFNLPESSSDSSSGSTLSSLPMWDGIMVSQKYSQYKTGGHIIGISVLFLLYSVIWRIERKKNRMLVEQCLPWNLRLQWWQLSAVPLAKWSPRDDKNLWRFC